MPGRTRGRALSVAEVPAPAGGLPQGEVGEVHLGTGASALRRGEEARTEVSAGGVDAHVVGEDRRVGAARPAHREPDGVRSLGRVDVGRLAERGRASVAEAPGPGGDRSGRGVREGDVERRRPAGRLSREGGARPRGSTGDRHQSRQDGSRGAPGSRRHEGHVVGTGGGVHVHRVPSRRRPPVAEAPLPGGDLALGGVGEGDRQGRDAAGRLGREAGHGRLRDGVDADQARLRQDVRAGRAADRQGDGVGPGAGVHVGRALDARARAVAEAPAPARHVPVRAVREGHRERRHAGGRRRLEGRGRRHGRGTDADEIVLPADVGSVRARDRERDRVGAGRGVDVDRAGRGGGGAVAEAPAPARHAAARPVDEGDRQRSAAVRGRCIEVGRRRRSRQRDRDVVGANELVGALGPARDEPHRVRPRRVVGVARRSQHGAGTVAEVPAPARDVAGGEVGEGHRERRLPGERRRREVRGRPPLLAVLTGHHRIVAPALAAARAAHEQDPDQSHRHAPPSPSRPHGLGPRCSPACARLPRPAPGGSFDGESPGS